MLIDSIFQQARAVPGKPAFIHNGSVCTYAGFSRRIAAAHGLLSARPLPAGGIAVLCMGSLAEAWVWGIAVRRLGLATIVVERAEDLGPVTPEEISCVMTVAGEEHPGLSAWMGGAVVDIIRVPASADAEQSGELVQPCYTLPPAGHIQMTSGTTGSSKKILRDASNEERTLHQLAATYGISADSLVYTRDFPLNTAGGFRWPLLTWLQGGTVVFQQWRDYHRPYFDHQLTHAFASPFVLHGLLQVCGDELRRDDGMRLFVVASAPTRALAAKLKERLTQQVYDLLGSTEAQTVGLTLIETPDDLNWHHILPGREVQIVDEDDRLLPAGQVGLIRIRLIDDVKGYLGNAEATALYFRDGYFYPGDLGMLRADGRLALHGRVTDVINVLGTKYFTAPIEEALQERLDAAGVCVFSKSGHGADEEVHIVIQLRGVVTRPELEKLAKEHPFDKFPKIHFHFVEQLPRNTVGKVMRWELKKQLAQRGAFKL